MNIIELLSLPISLVALVVSIYAAKQSSQYRRGDRYVEAARLAAECGARIADIVGGCKSLQPEWHSILHARGMLQSTVREQIDQELESIAYDANSLSPRLGELAQGLEGLRNSALDRSLVQLSAVKLAIDGVEARLKESERKRKESRDSYQTSRPGHR